MKRKHLQRRQPSTPHVQKTSSFPTKLSGRHIIEQKNIATSSNVQCLNVKQPTTANVSQSHEKKTKFTTLKPSTAVKLSEETPAMSRFSKTTKGPVQNVSISKNTEGTLERSENSKITEGTPKKLKILKTIQEPPPRKNNVSRTNENSKNIDLPSPSTLQPLLPTARNNAFSKRMVKKMLQDAS